VKILHVLDHSLPLHSGYAFRSRNILRAQKALGWQPYVVTSPKHSIHGGISKALREEIDGVIHFRTANGKSVAPAPFNELLLMRELAQQIRQVAEHNPPDIIHAHSPVLNALPALWEGSRLDIPVVYEVRALWEDAAVDHGTYGQTSWKYHVTRLLETYVCKKAANIVVLSQGLKDDLVSRGIPVERLAVIGNAIDVGDFQDRSVEKELRTGWKLAGKKVIGFIGSFYRYEGIDLLVAAMSVLTRTYPELVLLLIGGGEVEHELRSKVVELGLNDKVVIPGRMPHESISSIYALMDILVYPRRSMRLTELVTPLKPLEAMAMGKPVIASDIGGHRELIEPERTGILFPPGDVSGLVNAIERLVKDEHLTKVLGKQGAQWVRDERSWRNSVISYREVYSSARERLFLDKPGLL
jgi:PEP-CTERM/exosortase A-associated glycosyltransferase